jgi:bacteriophage N4 adsorption protein B
MHDFPTGAQLLRRRQRLGDLLQSWHAVDEHALSHALKEQSVSRKPLGRILMSQGWLDDETLAEAIAYQAGLPRAALNAELVLKHASQLSTATAARHRVIYIGLDSGGKPMIAVANALSEAAVLEIGQELGMAPRQRIVRESEIANALQLMGVVTQRDVDVGRPAVPRLGDLLIEQGLLQRKVFQLAMLRYRPDMHGRIGDYLVDKGVIVREVIERVVQQQRELHIAFSDSDQQVQVT